MPDVHVMWDDAWRIAHHPFGFYEEIKNVRSLRVLGPDIIIEAEHSEHYFAGAVVKEVRFI